jgi:hypothetical protein
MLTTSFKPESKIMTSTNSFRALTLAAALALSAPVAASAAENSVGNSAVPSESIAPLQTTRGSVNVAENTGNAVSASGNPLATRQPVSEMAAGNTDIRVGNGASAEG